MLWLSFFLNSADQLTVQKRNFSITKPCIYELEAEFLIKSGYYNVPSPSTTSTTENEIWAGWQH